VDLREAALEGGIGDREPWGVPLIEARRRPPDARVPEREEELHHALRLVGL
jgi:hypothetical protein